MLLLLTTERLKKNVCQLCHPFPWVHRRSLLHYESIVIISPDSQNDASPEFTAIAVPRPSSSWSFQSTILPTSSFETFTSMSQVIHERHPSNRSFSLVSVDRLPLMFRGFSKLWICCISFRSLRRLPLPSWKRMSSRRWTPPRLSLTRSRVDGNDGIFLERMPSMRKKTSISTRTPMAGVYEIDRATWMASITYPTRENFESVSESPVLLNRSKNVPAETVQLNHFDSRRWTLWWQHGSSESRSVRCSPRREKNHAGVCVLEDN